MTSLLDATIADGASGDPEDVTGLPVVTIGGDDIASIHDVIVEDGDVTGWSLEKRTLFGGMLDRVLPTTAVLAIGPDAVVVADERVLVLTDDDEPVVDVTDDGPRLRSGPGDHGNAPAASPVVFGDARGTAVVALDSGETVGRVDRLVLDPVEARVGSIRLDNTSSDVRFLSWREIVDFDDETVTIPTIEVLRLPDGPREDGCRSTFRTRGRTMLTDDGVVLGEVADIEFDRADGRVTALLLEDGARVEGGRLRGVGPHAVVVRA